jgi:NitT/TauT family transport system substrate-binding protein
MRRSVFALIRLPLLGLALALSQPSLAADKMRLAVQATGTTLWDLAVVSAFKLDKEAGLDLEVAELASTEAGKIALQGDSADLIVSDWLWAARERASGAKLLFYPASTGIGAVMTKDPQIRGVKDLVGKKLGVAGGPLDKSWLLLKAFALKQGVDLEKGATVLYGAPPLLAEKARQGEIDAVLEFWNFAVDLEAQGFARAIDMTEVEKSLGAQGGPIVTGFVFKESFAPTHRDALARFFAMMKKARALIAADETAWQAAAARIRTKDRPTLALYRRRYVEATPQGDPAAQRRDLSALFSVLAAIGGERLVGPAKSLDASVFYEEAKGNP